MRRALDALQQKLIGAFLEEASEGLGIVEAGLLTITGGGGTPSSGTINEVFRAIHSIKGGAGGFGLEEVGELAHEMESHLERVRSGQQVLSPTLARALLDGVDALRELLTAAQSKDQTEPAPTRWKECIAQLQHRPAAQQFFEVTLAPEPDFYERGLEMTRFIRELEALGSVEVTCNTSTLGSWPLIDPRACQLSWTVRLSTAAARAQVDDVIDWVGGASQVLEVPGSARAVEATTPEMVANLVAPPPPSVSAPRPSATAGGQSSVRIPLEKVDALMNMVGELVITQAMLGELDDETPLTSERIRHLREALGQLSRNTRSLQEQVMRLRSLPLSTVLTRVPRLVHDLSAQLGKQVDYAASGESTELDKTIIERLGDPIIHLVRNALDHGLELPEERKRAGKPPMGQLRLEARHRGSEVLVQVSDDGRGIDRTKVRAKAERLGLMTADEKPTDAELLRLILMPGFSTATEVSEISGRGVGMDVVNEQVRGIGGDVAIESTPGVGTTFTLRLPLTLAIVQGQLVRVGGLPYVIPLLSITESVQPEVKQLRRLGAGMVYRLRDELIPMVDLGSLLGRPSPLPPEERLMVVVEGDGEQAGLLVDELLGQQQFVVKSLEANYGRVEGVSGATILGDGSVSFILEVAGLTARLKGANRAQRSAA